MNHRKEQLFICILVLGTFSIASGVHATNQVLATHARITSVSLFKNGFGYFRSGVNISNQASIITLGQLPVPTYGTFWVGVPERVELKQLTTAMEKNEYAVSPSNMTELLRLNEGKEVALWVDAGQDSPLRGTIMEVVAEMPPSIPSPYVMGMSQASPAMRSAKLSAPASSLIMLEMEEGIVALDAGSIRRAEFMEPNIALESFITTEQPAIRIELAKPVAKKLLEVSWLAKGVTWAPSYRIDLSDPDLAAFEAKALVMNELMDMEGIQLELVTGYPNILFSDIRSPMAMQDSLAEFLSALADGASSANRGTVRSVVAQQAVMLNLTAMGGADSPDYIADEKGRVSEDLFLYPVEDVDLKRDETIYLPLFATNLPYRHVYTWEIDDYMDDNNRYRSSIQDQRTEEVWHSCRIENTSDMPLTTAPVEFIKDGQFVGQDICHYTAPRATTTIRINRAMNVLAEQAEFEEKRERNAATFHGSQFDKVTVRGELKLRSRLDRTVDVEITKELSGEVLSTYPRAEDTKTAAGLRQVNPKHNLVWDTTLDAGRTKTIRYEYEVFVRD